MNRFLINLVKLLTFSIFFVSFSSFNSHAKGDDNSIVFQHKPLTMFIWSNQLAPIISHESLNNLKGPLSDYQGIIVDVFNSLPEEKRPQIEVVLSGRKRGERDLYAGLIDMSMLSYRWLESPEKLIFSLPVYTHREYLYATSPVPDKELKALVTNKKICIRRGYKFPNIDPFFNDERSIRVENEEETTLFELLLRGRCDFLLTNEFVANAIIEANQWQDIIYKTAFSIDDVGFTIAFHPKHKDFVQLLNKHIREMENTGQLERIIKSQTQLH